MRYQRSEQNCLNTLIWFNFSFVDQLKREFCGIMFHDPACQRSQMFGKSFTPKTLSVGHWIILSVSGIPFRSLFLLRFPRLLDPPVQGSEVKIDGQAESDLCHVSVTLLAGILFISAAWPPDGLILPGFAYQSRLASIIHQYTDSVLQTITVHLGCCLKLFNPQPSTLENYF